MWLRYCHFLDMFVHGAFFSYGRILKRKTSSLFCVVPQCHFVISNPGLANTSTLIPCESLGLSFDSFFLNEEPNRQLFAC